MLDSTFRSTSPAISNSFSSPSGASRPTKRLDASFRLNSPFNWSDSGPTPRLLLLRSRLKLGFTLIELLVVVAIISILAAILFPVFARAREKSRQTSCSSNLKQFALAWLMYTDDYDETAVMSYNKIGNPRIGYAGDANDAWDFKQLKTGAWTLGMLGPYTTTGQLSACPDFVYPKGFTGRPYNGYAYNATYIGGDMGTPQGDFPAAILASIQYPSQTALFADGGYGTVIPQPENFLRAPSDAVYYPGGLVDFRHKGLANVAYADGHVKIARDNCPFQPAFPEFGGISSDDSAYGPGMKPCSAHAH